MTARAVLTVLALLSGAMFVWLVVGCLVGRRLKRAAAQFPVLEARPEFVARDEFDAAVARLLQEEGA